MNNDKNQTAPQPQTATNPSGEPVNNPFKNSPPSSQDVQQPGEESEKEQQFKEAQTERD